ncbi:hypothetical protein ACWGQ5_41115 [Streptomyces sp. NPDC055722]
MLLKGRLGTVVGALPVGGDGGGSRSVAAGRFRYNEAHAYAVLTAYIRHYDQHRPHQSRQQRPPDSTEPPAPATVTDLQAHRIRRPVLDGLINEYHHAA